MLILLLSIIVIISARLSSNAEYEKLVITNEGRANINEFDINTIHSKSIRSSNILILLVVIYSLFLNYNMSSAIWILKNDSIPLFNNLLSYSFSLGMIHNFLLFVSILIIAVTTFRNYDIYSRILNISNIDWINNLLIKEYSNHSNNNENTWMNNLNIANNYMYEYMLIIIFNIIGACYLVLSNNLISFFLTLELQSYSLYLLSSINRDSQNATAAGLKYFLLGGLSSAIILLGSGILYRYTGLINIENIISLVSTQSLLSPINIGLILILIGLLFKVSAAPFHFWSPDVYSYVPTIVTTYIAILPKISLLVFISSLLIYSFNNLSVYVILLLSSILSLLVGTLLGLTQINIKRLFAYSSITNIGFLLLALAIHTIESLHAFVFYLFQYTLTNLNGFFILLAFGYCLHAANFLTAQKTNLDKYSPLLYISQLKSQLFVNPFLALSLAITLFSFAGVPPLIGFFGKFWILLSSLNQGYIFYSIIIVITSVIGGVYYLKIIQTMMTTTNVPIPEESKELEIRSIVNKLESIIDNNENNDTNSKESMKVRLELSNWMQRGTATIYLSNIITGIISILTLFILLYILLPTIFLNMTFMVVIGLIS